MSAGPRPCAFQESSPRRNLHCTPAHRAPAQRRQLHSPAPAPPLQRGKSCCCLIPQAGLCAAQQARLALLPCRYTHQLHPVKCTCCRLSCAWVNRSEPLLNGQAQIHRQSTIGALSLHLCGQGHAGSCVCRGLSTAQQQPRHGCRCESTCHNGCSTLDPPSDASSSLCTAIRGLQLSIAASCCGHAWR